MLINLTLIIHLRSEVAWTRMTNHVLLIKQGTQKSMTPLGEVEKRFPQRGSLFMYQLVKCAIFICNRCTLGKTSKLVGYAKDERTNLCAMAAMAISFLP